MGNFALLDPATQINADPCGSGYGSGSATLICSKLFFNIVQSSIFLLSLGSVFNAVFISMISSDVSRSPALRE
jgi:hypothetical protein